MKLYHGSNVEIDKIDLSFAKKGKDFGCGFYLNANKQQALEMAKRTTYRLMEGTPTINTFSFEDSALNERLDINVKIFDDYTKECAEFVLMNRNNKSETPAHPYDIVIGPIANDTVGVQIRRFIMGYISIDKLIEELRYRGNHAIQYFFGTENAINLLTKIKE